MHIGVPREIKNHQYRVGLTPTGVKSLIDSGHRVFVEQSVGVAIDYTDEMTIKSLLCRRSFNDGVLSLQVQ